MAWRFSKRALTKRTHLRHGAVEPLFGVRIGDLKPLQRKLKGRQELAPELYATGNSDAMYLAGLIAEGYILKSRRGAPLAPKRKTARC